MLTDDSAGEQCAVRKAFPSLQIAETEVTHLLCRVHSRRTIDKNLAGDNCKESRKHLMAALYNRWTKIGCHESVEQAIKAAPPNNKAYIQKEWLKTAADWANYARCHSALLLQSNRYKCS